MSVTLPARSAINQLKWSISRFQKCEDGNLIIFSVFTLVVMAIFVSTGIDAMRTEVLRTQLQNTSDRAVLAASDLQQTLTPEEVALDYFTRAGFDPALANVTSSTSFGRREVENSSRIDLPTRLLHLVGNESLPVIVNSSAQEANSNVEISLVLDYSLSMRGTKYEALIGAASTFVGTVFDGPAGPGTTINYVPYAGAVNPGRTFFELMGGQAIHDNSSCLELDATDFQNAALPSGSYTQVPHFENWFFNIPTGQWGWCPPEENRLRAATQNRDLLVGAIESTKMNGGTGTDIAMKYGVALLDPANRATLATLSPLLPAAERPIAGRPLDWFAEDTQKYIVLMTDGGITGQMRPKKTGIIDSDDDGDDNEVDLDDIDGVDYDKINAEVLLSQQGPYDSGSYWKRTKNSSLTNFYAMCDYAKTNGVLVFTIAYQAPAAAQTQMQNCATSSSFYYNITDIDIAVAFGSIALQINRLRLTN